LLTSLALGALRAEAADSALLSAWISFLVFSAGGCVIGWIAGRTIEESIHARLLAELDSEEAAESPTTA